MMFYLNVQDNNDEVYAHVTKPTFVITRVRMLHFHKRHPSKESDNFEISLFQFYYSNTEKFDKVVAKINGAVFCLTVYTVTIAVLITQ